MAARRAARLLLPLALVGAAGSVRSDERHARPTLKAASPPDAAAAPERGGLSPFGAGYLRAPLRYVPFLPHGRNLAHGTPVESARAQRAAARRVARHSPRQAPPPPSPSLYEATMATTVATTNAALAAYTHTIMPILRCAACPAAFPSTLWHRPPLGSVLFVFCSRPFCV